MAQISLYAFFLIQMTAGLLYYFGDNLDIILTDYGSDI